MYQKSVQKEQLQQNRSNEKPLTPLKVVINSRK
jgi:hypothetical protein